jgi:regulator of protease activity HflC (stomatin/prohibitin superfamily)
VIVFFKALFFPTISFFYSPRGGLFSKFPPFRRFEMGNVVSVAAVLLLCTAIYRAIISVSKGECVIVENVMTGDCRRVDPGLHFVTPFIYRPRHVNWKFTNFEGASVKTCVGTKIPTTDLCYDPTALESLTQDGVPVQVNLVVYFNISNPEDALLKVADVFHAIETVLETSTFSAVAQMKIEDLSTAHLRKLMPVDEITEQMSEWGVAIKKVEVQEILPPRTIRDATTNILAEERKARAELVKMEHEQKQKIMMAETEMREQECRHERERAQTEHAANIKRTQAESAAFAKKVKAEAEAQAHEVVRGVEITLLERELKAISEHEPLMPLLQTRASAKALADLGSTKSTKLVIAPGDVLATVAQMPVVRTIPME